MLGNNWSSKQLRKILIKEYPYLMPRNSFTGEPIKDYDYTFIEGEYNLPKGWLQLFLQCCEDIKEPLVKADCLDKFRFVQVKEKYGSMRLYTCGATKEVLDIIDKYEFLSQQVCSVCGKPATVMTYGYICPYCSEHVSDMTENIDDARFIEINTLYTKKTWAPESIIEITIDCKDEWNRYLERIEYKNE